MTLCSRLSPPWLSWRKALLIAIRGRPVGESSSVSSTSVGCSQTSTQQAGSDARLRRESRANRAPYRQSTRGASEMSAKPSHINTLITPPRLQQYSATEVTQDGRASVRPAGNVTAQFEPLLDSDEAAALLKIHPKTLQRMARRGQVVGIQIGKLWRFRTSDLNKMLEEVAS